MPDDLKELQDLGLSEEQAKAVAEGPLAGLLRKRDELLGTVRELKDRASGDSTGELRKRLEQMEAEKERAAALAKDDYEKALEVDRKKYEKDLATLKAERDEIATKFQRMVVGNALTEGATKAGVSPDYLDAAIALHRDRVTIADDSPTIDGKPVQEHFAEWVKSDAGKRYAAAPNNSGAGAKGPGNSGDASPPKMKRSEMDAGQKAAFIQEHGGEAYLKLPQ